MNYAEVLKNNLSRHVIDEIALSVINDESNFQELFSLVNHSDNQISWRSTWACEKIVDINPHLINESYFEKIIELTLNTKIDGQRRLLLSIIYKLQSIYAIPVPLLNNCFEWMVSEKQAIAVQALSLKILTQYCLVEPDLKPELIAYLDNFSQLMSSPAMISVCKKSYKQLLINN